VLLDENLPHLLRNNLGDHDVFTVRYKGWAGLNGGLLTAEGDEFDVLVTGDQTLPYEQNLSLRRIAILTTDCDYRAVIDRLAHLEEPPGTGHGGDRQSDARFSSKDRLLPHLV